MARTDAVDRYVSPRDSLNFNILGSPPGAVVAAASAAAAAASSAPSPPPLDVDATPNVPTAASIAVSSSAGITADGDRSAMNVWNPAQ